jgi:hypothetical protein
MTYVVLLDTKITCAISLRHDDYRYVRVAPAYCRSRLFSPYSEVPETAPSLLADNEKSGNHCCCPSRSRGFVHAVTVAGIAGVMKKIYLIEL